jgi:uncharacterized protein (DUF58 family)
LNKSILTPDQVAKLGNLDVVARLVVEGFLVGLHRSPYHGFSVEFAEYRQYIPGEPASNIDWRVFGKSDRYYTRIFAEETNLRATILVDASSSMSFKSEKNSTSKIEYARLLAASLTYLLLKQNDAVGLELFSDKLLASVPARAVRKQLFQVLKELDHIPEPQSTTSIGQVLHKVAEKLPRRGLIVLISDLMDNPKEIMSGLKHFRYRGHEVVVFHLLDSQEIDFDYRGEARFEDLETGDNMKIDPAHLRASYQNKFEQWRTGLREESRGMKIDFVEMTTNEPFDRALMAYLRKRTRMR